MKLQVNSNFFGIFNNNYIASSQLLTRDFKCFPLTCSAVGFNQTNSYLYSYKNPILKCSTSIGARRNFPCYLTGYENNGVNYLVYTTPEKEITGSNKLSFSNNLVDCTTTSQVVPLPRYKTQLYLYADGGDTQAGSSSYYSYGNPVYSGFSVREEGGSALLYFNFYSNDSHFCSNYASYRIISQSSERDIVGLDTLHSGRSARTISSTTGISNITINDIITQGSSSNKFSIFSIDKNKVGNSYTITTDTDWDTTISSDYTDSQPMLGTQCSLSIDNSDGTFTLYHVRRLKSDNKILGLWKLVGNEQDHTVQGTLITLDVPIPFDIYNCTNTNYSYNYHTEYYRENNKSFVTIVICSNTNNSTYAINVGVYTYEVDEATNTATFKGSYKNPNNYIMSYFMIDSKTMLTASPLGYEILSFDVSAGVWKKTAGKDLSLDSIAYDDVSNALFYVDTSNTAYMDKLDLAMTADWGWSNPNQIWEGSAIDTTLYMSCADYTGKLVSQNVTLYIEGNAVFTENNLKSITVSTSATDKILIPVQITGDGVITVSAKAAI